MRTLNLPNMLLSRIGIVLVAMWLVVSPARASADTPAPPFPGCVTDVLPNGAYSLICIPIPGVTSQGPWNHGLVVYAHGYVNFNEPLQVMPDGPTIPLTVLSQGFAFATTSYRQNGLVILEGADDIRELMAAFIKTFGPAPTYIVGASEGGLITTLLIERSGLFIGGLAACGPIGNFRGQLDYFGDFRVLFDYYFPNLIPGEAIRIPTTVIENWYTSFYPHILSVLTGMPALTDELLRVAHVAHPFDPTDQTTFVIQALFALDVLRYSVFGTNDAFMKLGGNSFDNGHRVYTNSSDDEDLNRRVHRFNAQKAALETLRSYETSGDLTTPIVTLHTLGDQVIPYGLHEPVYEAKVSSHNASAFLVQDPVAAFGHCNFQLTDVLTAFQTLRSLGGF